MDRMSMLRLLKRAVLYIQRNTQIPHTMSVDVSGYRILPQYSVEREFTACGNPAVLSTRYMGNATFISCTSPQGIRGDGYSLMYFV